MPVILAIAPTTTTNATLSVSTRTQFILPKTGEPILQSRLNATQNLAPFVTHPQIIKAGPPILLPTATASSKNEPSLLKKTSVAPVAPKNSKTPTVRPGLSTTENASFDSNELSDFAETETLFVLPPVGESLVYLKCRFHSKNPERTR